MAKKKSSNIADKLTNNVLLVYPRAIRFRRTKNIVSKHLAI